MGNATQKKNWRFIIGVLILSIGTQFASYGMMVSLTGEVNKMGAAQYYVLIAALGTMGMMLILPTVGKLTAICGLRNIILCGIVIQTAGRICMMFCTDWIPYTLAYLLQSIGGGLYISSAYVNMSSAVDAKERTRFFGYIAVANAIGAVFGPIIISAMYSAGGLMAKLSYVGNLPLTILGFLMIMKDCSNEKNAGAAKGFDFPGLLVTVAGLAGLVLLLNLGGKMFAWFSVPTAILAVLAVVCLIIMIKRETTIANPAVPVQMFKNKRLTSAFICAMVGSAYGACAASYSLMWIRLNYGGFGASSFFNGTATMPQQIMILLLGTFLAPYISKKFIKRFRPFGILSMVTALIALTILFCLQFTGTAKNGNVMTIANGTIPVGMVMIYIATAIGGFTSAISQATYSAFWQSNTPREDIPSGQALYSIGSTGGSAIFGAVCGVVLGSSGDYSRAFATGMVFALIGLIVAITNFKFTKEEIAAADQA